VNDHKPILATASIGVNESSHKTAGPVRMTVLRGQKSGVRDQRSEDPMPRLSADAGLSAHWTAADRRPMTDNRKGDTA